MALSGAKRGTLNSEINVTPMVDVMLVLLVIFMITAPMMHTGVDVDLPETEGAVTQDPEGRLTLSISKSHELFLGATRVDWANLEEKLLANERVKNEKELYIEADKDLPYAVVVTAMAAAQRAGVVKLQMMTDPSANLDYTELDRTVKKAAPVSPIDDQ